MTNMANIEVLTPADSAAWMRALDRCAPYDFYHLPQYHTLAEDAGEGMARLFVCTDGAYTIALPLLIREVAPGVRDATSVYGYAGPVCSHSEIPDSVARNFQAVLAEILRELGIVSVFSRLHPILTQRSVLANLGEFRVSQTVSIDLTQPPALQRSLYRKAFKEGINKLRRHGVTVVHDLEGRLLPEFVQIYHETMQRVEAADRYYFSASYFEKLWQGLGSRIHHFMCMHEGRAVCGGLFVACHGIIQYHLGGTLNDALALSPMKVLVDEVRLWGTSQGMQLLHLGGGTSADPDDSLLHYKRGFSDRGHEFAAWRWILDPDVYERLCATRSEENERAALKPASADFFPAYRTPVIPIDMPNEIAHAGHPGPSGPHGVSLVPAVPGETP